MGSVSRNKGKLLGFILVFHPKWEVFPEIKESWA
jgi:hypothetical protein